jgi:hypothetical protein
MDLEWFSVNLEARPPADGLDFMASEDASDALMELLEYHDGIVSAGNGSWDATFSIQAGSPWEAVSQGGALIEKLAVKAGMPSWPIVRVQAVRQDLLNAENAKPTLPELVSVPEAAEILNVSPQRVHELARAHPRFPEPMYELRTGKLWLREAIEAFALRWDRKPGRPRKALTALSLAASMEHSHLAHLTLHTHIGQALPGLLAVSEAAARTVLRAAQRTRPVPGEILPRHAWTDVGKLHKELLHGQGSRGRARTGLAAESMPPTAGSVVRTLPCRRDATSPHVSGPSARVTLVPTEVWGASGRGLQAPSRFRVRRSAAGLATASRHAHRLS